MAGRVPQPYTHLHQKAKQACNEAVALLDQVLDDSPFKRDGPQRLSPSTVDLRITNARKAFKKAAKLAKEIHSIPDSDILDALDREDEESVLSEHSSDAEAVPQDISSEEGYFSGSDYHGPDEAYEHKCEQAAQEAMYERRVARSQVRREQRDLMRRRLTLREATTPEGNSRASGSGA